MDVNFEALRWIVATLVIAPAGLLVRWLVRIRAQRKRRRAQIAYLAGFPPEAKEVLFQFYDECAHTVRGDPGSRGTQLLIRSGLIVVKGAAGPYAAVNSYLSLRGVALEVVDGWVAIDPWARERIAQADENFQRSDQR